MHGESIGVLLEELLIRSYDCNTTALSHEKASYNELKVYRRSIAELQGLCYAMYYITVQYSAVAYRCVIGAIVLLYVGGDITYLYP